MQNDHHPFKPYKIAHRHVQQALKYSRLGIKSYYLRKLMQPTPVVFMMRPRGTGTYFARPKIVAGRFLLHEHFVFHEETKMFNSGDTSSFHGFCLCPHIGFQLDCLYTRTGLRGSMRNRQGKLVPTDGGLYSSLIRATGPFVGMEILGGCHQCLTDYTMCAYPDGNDITMNLWRDFGPFGPSDNPVWTSHVYDPFMDPIYIWDRPIGTVRAMYNTKSQQIARRLAEHTEQWIEIDLGISSPI